MARIGVFGGSFDPIHYGHLWIAELAREQLRLDQVRFLPAAISPLKADKQLTTSKDRLEMVQLAINGNEAFVVDDREVKRGGISYTVETLRDLQAEQPGNEWWLIVGADSLNDFPKWREPAEICRLAMPAVAIRRGMPEPDWTILERYLSGQRLQEAREACLKGAQIEVSSSELRSSIEQGNSIRYRMPAAVESYIRQARLYLPKAP